MTVKSRMLKSIDFQTDDRSEYAQNEVATLRIIDDSVRIVFNNNMRRSADVNYRPELVIYVGWHEYCCLSRVEMTNSPADFYRGFEVIKVHRDCYLRVVCTNPAGFK